MEMEQVSANQGRIYLNGVVNEEMAVAVSYYANKIIEGNKRYDSLGMKDKKINKKKKKNDKTKKRKTMKRKKKKDYKKKIEMIKLKSL